ncbi:MAG: hypothetical protein AAF485_20625 [Chloroflexota bacterium]
MTSRDNRLSIASHQSFVFWILLIVLIGVGVFLSRTLTGNFPLTADEGLYINRARLLAAGFEPYSQVYLTFPPIVPILLDIVWSIWPTVNALRYLFVSAWALSVVGIALIGREISQQWQIGIITAFILGFSGQYLRDSQAIIISLPSIMPAIFAVWLALLYQRNGHTGALIGSGVATSMSLWIKFLMPFLPIFILGMVLARHVTALQEIPQTLQSKQLRQTLLRTIFLWGIGTIILPLLTITFWGNADFLESTFLQRFSARDAYQGAEDDYWAPRLKRLNEYIADHRVLIGLAILGLTSAFYARNRGRWVVLIWLGFALAMLTYQTPVRTKHFVLLSAPLALGASFLFTFLMKSYSKRALGIGLLSLALLLFL